MNKSVNDVDLKNDILSELKYEPSIKTSDIGVLVKDGIVTLNGNATSYWEKSNVVRAVKRVIGVTAIADEMIVKLPGSVTLTDSDVAAAAAQHIKWSSSVPDDMVKLTVRDGWITLEGDVEWWYQKKGAENAVHFLRGVKGVSNEISIKPKMTALEIETEIKSAFQRNAMLDADKVEVSISGNKVTLRGKVRTYAEKEEAGRTAWAAPGVTGVDNYLEVNWFELER